MRLHTPKARTKSANDLRPKIDMLIEDLVMRGHGSDSTLICIVSLLEISMRCPYCNKEAKIKEVVKRNLECYGGSVKVRTNCCGKLVRVRPIIKFACSETEQKGEDDWGN